ncbi:MAG: chemotaxis protein CheW [Candidatus Muiribacteriota bacterium]|jgi:purine-binding chemotaxis protein CheW
MENSSKEQKTSSGSEKYLTFFLEDEVYGLPILRVQEIIGMMKVTHFPKAPEFVRGVINLRGKVIPVIDLRLRFGLKQIDDTEKTCIVVLSLKNDSGEIRQGIIVDEVSEVIDIEKNQLEDSPDFGNSANKEFITGVGKVGEKVVIMLDVDGIFISEK